MSGVSARAHVIGVLAFTGAALSGVVPGSAYAYGVDITHYVGTDGRGFLVANPSPDGSRGNVSWKRCPSPAACEPISASQKDPRMLQVGDASVGTVFKATATDGGTSATASSRPYLGPVLSTGKPRLIGKPRIGRLVRPRAGTWTGGWGIETSHMQIQVCKKASRGPCLVLSDSVYWDRCKGAGALLPPQYKGRYVRIADTRTTTETPFPAFAVNRPQALDPLLESPRTVTTTVGRITGKTGSRPFKSLRRYARTCSSRLGKHR